MLLYNLKIQNKILCFLTVQHHQVEAPPHHLVVQHPPVHHLHQQVPQEVHHHQVAALRHLPALQPGILQKF